MELPLKSRRVLVFVDHIYEDLELWYPKLRLQEAGAEVVVAGPIAKEVYSGKHGYPCRSDAAIGEMRSADFSGVILPGGFMPDKFAATRACWNSCASFPRPKNSWPRFVTADGLPFRPACIGACA